jgi:NADH dehydrogenase
MSKAIFITGSGGFIGSSFMKSYDFSGYSQVYCLMRDSKKFHFDRDSDVKIHSIQADIKDVEEYEDFLRDCDTILHLAAATGKAISSDEYFDVNLNGTRALVESGKRTGVENILHISTIAVKYPDLSDYYYAQSKQKAELVIRESGLKYTIVRPTIVVGKGGPVWNNLARLARMPITPLFGGGRNRIQPIYIDDLVGCLLQILNMKYFQNEIIELGGSEVVTFEEFLNKIHVCQTKKPAKFVRLPYKPIKSLLLSLERPLNRILPVTAGQLSAFGNDGLIEENPIYLDNKKSMLNVQEMIATVLKEEESELIDKTLNHEGRIYTNFLIHQEPSDYVLDKYRQAHNVAAPLRNRNYSELENFALKLSRKNPLATRLVDAYAVFFMKGSIIRKKLILLMAILETSNPSALAFEQPDSSNVFKIILNLGLQGLTFTFALLVGLIIFIPARLWFAILRKPSRKEISYG